MFIRSLSLRHFRNLENVELQFSKRLNIFIGDNGHGKTNLLEAIYFLLEKESFRYGHNSNLVELEKEAAVIHSFIHNNNLEFHFRLNLTAQKKEFFINQKKNFQFNEFQFRAVLFSPESLSVIKESADERRLLIDQLVSMTSNSRALVIADFKRALKTRNKLLKDYQQEKINSVIFIDTIQSLNQIYFKLAAEVTINRLQALKEILPLVRHYLKLLNQNNKNQSNVEYSYKYLASDDDISTVDDVNNSRSIIEMMKKRAEQLSSAEMASGTTLVGPHKHDIVFLYNGNDSRFFCSQGQQRSIILAFKLAQIVYHQRVHGFYPVLLLDDVLSELDQNKQEALVSILIEIEAQTFLTSTDLSHLKNLRHKKDLSGETVFRILEGKIVNHSDNE